MEQPSPWYEHTDPAAGLPPAPSQGRLRRWKVAALAGTGSLALAGALVGYSLSGSAGADPSVGGQATTTTAPASQPAPTDRAQRRTDRLKELLQPLVDAGTITAQQRDAVVKQLADAAGARPGKREGHHIKGLEGGAAAKALGLSIEDLRTALRNGESLADIAKSKGIDVNKVIDEMVDQAMDAMSGWTPPAGRSLPTEAQVRERITAFVNGHFPKGLFGRDHRGGAPRGGNSDTTTTTVN